MNGLTLDFPQPEHKTLWHRILPLSAASLPLYAEVIRRSFATVAQAFNLTRENCPRHPSFYTNTDLEGRHGEDYFPFGYFEDNKLVGFVSLSRKSEGVFSLNNLAVLPEYRNKGYGESLLDFCRDKVKALGGNKIKIEIIGDNDVLRDWYIKKGYISTGTKRFEHLPFTVEFMEQEIEI